VQPYDSQEGVLFRQIREKVCEMLVLKFVFEFHLEGVVKHAMSSLRLERA